MTLETSPKKCLLLKNKKEALARGGKEAPQAGDGYRSVDAGLAACGEPWPDCSQSQPSLGCREATPASL